MPEYYGGGTVRGGYQQAQDDALRRRAADMQQVVGATGVLAKLAEQQRAVQQQQEIESLKPILAQAGGDPSVAIKALLASGSPPAIALAAKLHAFMPKQKEELVVAPESTVLGPPGPDGVRKPTFTAPPRTPAPAKVNPPGTLRQMQKDTFTVTEELQEDGTWKEIGRGPKFAASVPNVNKVVNEAPVTPVTLADPKDPNKTIIIDGRTGRVFGEGPKPTAVGAIDVKRTQELPKARLQVDSVIQNLDRLDTAISDLNKEPGLSNITGTVAGRTWNVTPAATNAQAKLDSIKSQTFVSALQSMREASKTGGAVGNVSDREGDRLENTLAALGQAQGTQHFRTELKKAQNQLRLSKAFNQKSIRGTIQPSSWLQSSTICSGRLRRLESDSIMADRPYKVQDPSGNIRIISGPEGATDEQVLAAAQSLFATPPVVDEPVQPKQPVRQYSLGDVAPVPQKDERGVRFKGLEPRLPDIPDLMNKSADAIGGAVTDVAAKVLPPEAAAAAGAITNAGLQAIPISTGAKVGAEVGAPAMRWLAEKSMTSALKLGVESLKGGSGTRAVGTMIDEGINVTKGGVDKMKGIISDLNAKVSAAIAAAPPGSIDKATAAGTLRSTLDKFKTSLDAKKDMPAVMQAWDDLLNHPIFSGRYLSVQDAQRMKQGIQMKLVDAFGELSTAAREGQKAIASGLRQKVSDLVPEVAGLNARESALLNALEYAEKRALTEGNKNVGGLAFLANNAPAAAAYMADKSSAFKSILARMLNAHKRTIPATAAGAGVYGAMNQPNDQE